MKDTPVPSGTTPVARPGAAADRRACLLLFAKPPVPGRVKTRLVPALGAARAAALQAAFTADLVERLRCSESFELRVAWAVAADEPLPAGVPAVRQADGDLGDRLLAALRDATGTHELVGAVGSDHPTLARAAVEEAFARLERDADLVLGPALDGGYALIALRAAAVHPRLFAAVPWSGPRVLAVTRQRAAELGLRVALLPPAADVDTADDLARLRRELEEDGTPPCPHTRALLAAWEHEDAAARWGGEEAVRA